jgi:hypothetical protein
MRIEQQELEHPRQTSRVRLNLYRYQPPPEERVSGMLPHQEGFLLTEDRIGTTVVVASLGFFAGEAEARAHLRQRASELAAQGYGPPVTPAPRPSLPVGALVASDPDDARAVLGAAVSSPPVRPA